MTEDAWVALDDMIETWPGDVAVKLEVGTESPWSAELRWTPEPNSQDGPDQSFVWWAVGGADAGEVLAEVVEAARRFSASRDSD
jgi:hypothetical protein